MDIGGLTKLSRDTLILLVAILGFMVRAFMHLLRIRAEPPMFSLSALQVKNSKSRLKGWECIYPWYEIFQRRYVFA